MASILIIDDDEQFRAMLRTILQRAGYEVLEARNGKQGLRIFYERSADLVITDMIMPIMPGSKLISILRDDHPTLKIIAISGGGPSYHPVSFLHYAKKLGADAILEKPVMRLDLLKIINELLEN